MNIGPGEETPAEKRLRSLQRAEELKSRITDFLNERPNIKTGSRNCESIIATKTLPDFEKAPTGTRHFTTQVSEGIEITVVGV